MKIIPAIDLMDGKVVRLYKGDPKQKTVYSDNPIDIAKTMGISRCRYSSFSRFRCYTWNGSNLDIIKKILDSVSIPVEVAGGLRDKSLVMEVAKSQKE